MRFETLKIKNLNQCPEYVPILAHWAFSEWYIERDIAFNVLLKAFSLRTTGAGFPLTLVALYDDFPVGMVTLKKTELKSRQDCSPWLSALYVIPGMRGHKIGKNLIDALKHQSFLAGFNKLFLFIDQRNREFLENYYTKQQWEFYDNAPDNDGEKTSIYCIRTR